MMLTVDIFSDVICPWCYVGKRRLEKAIATLGPAHPVQVRWLPFQLNPEMPQEGMGRIEYRTRKFGSLERSQALEATFLSATAAERLQFAFDRIERTPNTRDAHRLIWLAEQQAIQDAVVEGLFRAYFTEALDISARDILIDVVVEAGLDRTRTEDLLNGDEGLDFLQDAGIKARQIGISGVPFFIINREIRLSGAQPPETFLAAFQHAIASA
ncbi:DsbA family oxidoreductase [Schlesneria paludicola]|uniref:DsbA family oxidoreductase n=1 Tax=Schlesneria paludicola TaxID=360056 RepID=UPI00029A0952|nr:DsbA family oxidoreductase [Schlesneria paludicola]